MKRSMTMTTCRALLACLVTLLTPVAGISQSGLQSPMLNSHRIDSPAGPNTGEPNLTRGSDGDFYLSWIDESNDSLPSLVFCRRSGGQWSSSTPVASGDNWVVNWADFPAMATYDGQSILASWPEQSGLGKYAYGVRMSHSSDAGQTWGSPFFVHRDSTPTEHGFVSLVPIAADHIMAVWLDGRETVTDDGAMTLRAASLKNGGEIVAEYLLDSRVCDCCQTSAAVTGDGSLVVVYRDRHDDERRDISIVRFVDGEWTTPVDLHNDGWVIAGCPVNGPAVTSMDSMVAVAWFTVGNNDTARVNVAFSRDHGRSFGSPVRVDGGNPSGRVDIVVSDDSSAVVCWLEDGEKDAELMIRRVGTDGRLSAPVTVTTMSSERESGFPHLAGNGQDILLAWTDTKGGRSVQVALITLEK